MGTEKPLVAILLMFIVLFLSFFPISPIVLVHATQNVELAIFSNAIYENLVLQYRITEFESYSGVQNGLVTIGYDSDHFFRGVALSVTKNDIINIKIDSRDDRWEQYTGDTSMIYSSWDYGLNVWGPECNITLFPGGNSPEASWLPYEVDSVFSRMMVLPQAQLLVYPPNDGRDYSNYLVPMFGQFDDNGTIDPGTWTGSGYSLTSSLTYNPNATYYMFWDVFGVLQLQCLKIPATFSRDAAGNLLAHWNYSFYDMGYTLFTSEYFRWISWAYADGLWPFPPFTKVITNVNTGITQSVEFYFGEDSAWKRNITWVWGAEHPFLTQCKKLKLELANSTLTTFNSSTLVNTTTSFSEIRLSDFTLPLLTILGTELAIIAFLIVFIKKKQRI
ncbi:MAG: hypothetical protein ACFFBD_19310, partial [Candidatus Hodarchaeota archaeon]